MSFAAKLMRLPLPFDRERGDEVSDTYQDLSADLRRLVSGAAGSSPYLAGLLKQERDWAADVLLSDPDAALDTELASIPKLSDAELSEGLRRSKRRIALLAALADLGGVWPLEKVTAALTRLADAAIQQGLVSFVGAELRRGKIPGLDETALEDMGGMVVFAMGKMGAFELNYSSDIDLICLYDETRFDPNDAYEARAAFIRATRKLAQLLSENTAAGYVFRTDLRLRPDASVTPVCMGMEAAERYYESHGRTWERAAWIKARPCAGDLGGGERFLKTLSPFVWRRHLDFAAIQDAYDMRLRIRDHKGLHGFTLDGHDLKLGLGGIREIEFFTQTRQLIAGGRDPSLRARGTVEGLASLENAGWIPPNIRESLTEDYRAHRELEHRVQMVADQQTHALPNTEEGWARIAGLMGQADESAFHCEISERIQRVAERTEGFFTPDEAEPEGAPVLTPEQMEITERWRSYPALRSERAQESFRRLRPQLLTRLQRAAKPEEALLSLDGFLSGLPAGVQVFALFEANPQLVDLIVDIAATAPGLARYLSQNAGVLDAVIGGSFFTPWPAQRDLAAELENILGAVSDYEGKLDSARRWQKEWHFRIGVHLLRGLIGAEEAGKQYADLAGAVVATLFPIVAKNFALRHGEPPGRGAVALAMGSLGAGALTAGSDLDLIVIYDPLAEEDSAGDRPLPVRTYYARLTQALVTALSAPMSEGRLYEVDMRLRPSGKQGPVATSFEAFRAYQRTDAWTWEHLALTRARVAASVGSEADSLSNEVEAFRQKLLAGTQDRAKILFDVAEMRTRLTSAKPQESAWDVKRGPGAMMDIELLAETTALLTGSKAYRVAAQLRGMPKAGLGEKPDAMARAYRLYWSVQTVTRLLTDRPLDPTEIGEGGTAILLREAGVETLETLSEALTEAREEVQAMIAKALAQQTA